ncbi:P-loop domain-containing protein [Saccharothrix stipae]
MTGTTEGDLTQFRDLRVDHVEVKVGAPLPRNSADYRQQVLRIAPNDLIGRERELREMAEFCTRETGPDYLWWRANAWAGKSALLAWFALHPPERVRVVSFFITARFAHQSHRIGFVDNLMEQLLAILGESRADLLTDSTRDIHFMTTLADAAGRCARQGERLVLVVDGLDEDQGVTADGDAHSIAALLPRKPPAGMRVVMSGRLNPPVPADVPPEHPLHDGSIVRRLEPSSEAATIRVDLERELDRLLNGNRTQQDLLGLLASAIGGLTGRDLTELTGKSQREVDRHLRTVTGRSFAPDSGECLDPDAAYVLAHSELQRTAINDLGPDRVDHYRTRLHEWARRYHARGWPDDTPRYLFQPYFGMAREAGADAVMTWCATDAARHDHMLRTSGGDAAAMTEITTTRDVLLKQPEPNLADLVRLAVHRVRIEARNELIPVMLPRLLARLGEPLRGLALAKAVTDPEHRVRALVELVRDTEPTAVETRSRLLDRVEDLADTIHDERCRDVAWTSFGRLVAGTGDVSRAGELIARTGDTDRRERAWHSLIPMIAATGDFSLAESILRADASPETKVGAAASFARSATAAGLPDLAELATGFVNNRIARDRVIAARARMAVAMGSVDEALPLLHRLVDGNLHLRLATSLVRIASMNGDRTGARALARTLSDPASRSRALLPLNSSQGSGDLDRAVALACATRSPADRAARLIVLAPAVAAAGDLDRARSLTDLAEAAVRHIADRDVRVWTTFRVTDAAADLEMTVPDNPRMLNPVLRTQRDLDELAALADVTAGSEEWSTTLSARVDDLRVDQFPPTPRAAALIRLAEVTLSTGHPDRARQLAGEAEATARTAGRGEDDEALSDLTLSLANIGDFTRAEAVARLIKGSTVAAGTFVKVTHLAVLAGDSHAESAAADARRAIGSIDDRPTRHRMQKALEGAWEGKVDDGFSPQTSGWDSGFTKEVMLFNFRSAVAAGNLGEAQRLASGIPNTHMRAEAIAELVRLRVEQGEVDYAESLTQSIADPAYTARVLAGLDGLVDPEKITALMIELTVRDHWSTLIPLAALPDRTSLLEILSDEVTAALR